LSIGADRGDRGDWILLSGQDPSTFFVDKISKFFGYRQQPDLPDRFSSRAGSIILIVCKIFIDLIDCADATDLSALCELTESFGAFGHCQIASKKRKSDSRRELGIELERSLISILPD
jgi:hypothetical protein